MFRFAILCFFLAAGLGQGWATAQQNSKIFKGARDLRIDFEYFPSGPLTNLNSGEGTWQASADHAEGHAQNVRGGSRSLRLFGGIDRQVTWTLPDTGTDWRQMSFWAERWTRRAPFEFRVDVWRQGKWREVYRGDDVIRIGGFHTLVQIDLEGKRVEKVRFRCTSPPQSGVLLDDLRLSHEGPMRIESIEGHHRVLPVLRGNAVNPLYEVRILTEGNQNPIALEQVDFDFLDTDLGLLRKIDIFYTNEHSPLSYRDSKNNFKDAIKVGNSRKPSKKISLKTKQRLVSGENSFWICCELTGDASIDQTIGLDCYEVTLSNGSRQRPTMSPRRYGQALGIALRNSGDSGAAVYRIPGLATTNAGTLIAVYDVRWRGWGDLPGDIDVGMSRSTDRGDTWEPMRIIMDMGESTKHNGNGVGDPSVLVDRVTNTIWVAALWSHGNRGWTGSRPGLEPEETGQLVLAKSEDDGLTWSRPINITKQVKDPNWRLLLQGPGKGITMRDGTLVFPAQFKDAANMPHSTILYSKDRGESWNIGKGARSNTTEAQVVELEDDVLMLNMRDNRGGSRAVAITRDMGQTWSEHPTSRSALPEPVCMASLIRADELTNNRDNRILLFSNPAVSDKPRRNMTIQVSLDEGATWSIRGRVLLDEGISAGYSCMTMIDDKTIGILYEGSRAHLTFQRILLNNLLQAE